MDFGFVLELLVVTVLTLLYLLCTLIVLMMIPVFVKTLGIVTFFDQIIILLSDVSVSSRNFQQRGSSYKVGVA